MPIPLHLQLNLAGQRTLAGALKIRGIIWQRLPVRATHVSMQAISDVLDRLALIIQQLNNNQCVLRDLSKRHNEERGKSMYVPGNGDTCTICLEGPPTNPLNWQGVCNHAFHTDCIQAYFESCAVKAACPICRFPIEADDFATGRSVNDNDLHARWLVCSQHLQRLKLALDSCEAWVDDVIRCISKLLRILQEQSEKELETKMELHQEVNSGDAMEFEIICKAACKHFAVFRALRGGMTEEDAEELVKAQLALGFE